MFLHVLVCSQAYASACFGYVYWRWVAYELNMQKHDTGCLPWEDFIESEHKLLQFNIVWLGHWLLGSPATASYVLGLQAICNVCSGFMDALNIGLYAWIADTLPTEPISPSWLAIFFFFTLTGVQITVARTATHMLLNIHFPSWMGMGRCRVHWQGWENIWK